jgi:hypothetical protein
LWLVPAAEIKPWSGHRWFWLVVTRFGLWLVISPRLGLVVTPSRLVIVRSAFVLRYATLPIVKPASSAAVFSFSSR